MDINYLREFTLLVQTGNYQEAAEHLYISQSTLSKHIKKMEAELGVPLFTRTTRKVELSDYGRILYPYASQIVHLENEYTASLIENMEAGKKKLTIGSIPALAQYGITDLMVRFRQNNPSMELSVIQAGTGELKELLRAGKVELAFLREPEHSKREFARIAYAKDTLAVLLPPGHPMGNEEMIQLKDLADEEFIMLERGTMVHELAVTACEKSGFLPKITHMDHKIENIIDLVHKGMGVALLMDQLAYHHQTPALHIAAVTPAATTGINLCYRKEEELSIAARHFIQCMEQYQTHN